MTGQMEVNINKNPQSKEIAEWRFQASGIEAENRALEEIVARRNKVEVDSANFTEKLKTRLTSTLLQLEPGKFVIVKPSKRRGAVHAFPLGLEISFKNAEGDFLSCKNIRIIKFGIQGFLGKGTNLQEKMRLGF